MQRKRTNTGLWNKPALANSIDLEALLTQPTVQKVMEELIRQTGCTSRRTFLDLITLYDGSGVLAETTSAADMQQWFGNGKIPQKKAIYIEGAVQEITGQYAPFLTRLYNNRNRAHG